MSRYIDADKLVEKYERVIEDEWNKKTSPTSWAEAYDCVIADIDDQPTADVVEVVRCKDCIYNSNGSCTHSEIYDDPNYNPDYYCADGERREE